MVEEIWKTAIVDGEPWENYQVSNLGNILSLNYRNTGRAELMTPVDNGHGYLRVNLSKNKETKKCLVHRLIAETFLPNPEGKPQVNHKIEGKKGKTLNMVIFNEDGTINKEKTTIEWVTPKENSNYATRNERIAKVRSKHILQFSKSGEFIREWESTAECGRNGFDSSAVWRCCQGERKSAYGFKWCYA